MARNSMDLLELLRKGGMEDDIIRNRRISISTLSYAQNLTHVLGVRSCVLLDAVPRHLGGLDPTLRLSFDHRRFHHRPFQQTNVATDN